MKLQGQCAAFMDIKNTPGGSMKDRLLAKLADRTLWYSSNSPAFVRSHTGLLALLQALAFGVYSRDTSQYDERIRAFKLK